LLLDELIPAADRADSAAAPVAYPGEAVIVQLLGDSGSAWWDDSRTPGHELRDDILAEALRRGLVRAVAQFGAPESDGWIWASAHTANIYHYLRMPALSALKLPVQGGPSTISPTFGQGTAGASWRMVVELGPEVRAWGTYPGGQSGNPASAGYLDRIPRWVAGELDTLRFPKSAAELPATQIRSRLTLTAGGVR
jgi:penicillin amidase